MPAPDLPTSLAPQAKLSNPPSFHATGPEQSICAHFSKRVDSEKAHVPADLGGKDIDSMADTGFASDCCRIKKRTPDEDERRPERRDQRGGDRYAAGRLELRVGSR